MPDRSLYLAGSVDSHCHLSHIPRDTVDVPAVLNEAAGHGMRAVIDVGIAPDDLDSRLSLLGRCDVVRFTSGLHPAERSRSDVSDLLALLERQVADNLIVAVGEIGLDYYRDPGGRSDAVALFNRQLAIAREAGLPVIVHNRDADDDILRSLRDHETRGVMHCFSQSPDFCRACLDMGMLVSFGGNLTFKRSDEIRESARVVPDSMLLVETDAPYLSPEPVRGRANHPGHLAFTIERLAEIRQTTPERLAHLTGTNASRLFEVATPRSET